MNYILLLESIYMICCTSHLFKFGMTKSHWKMPSTHNVEVNKCSTLSYCNYLKGLNKLTFISPGHDISKFKENSIHMKPSVLKRQNSRLQSIGIPKVCYHSPGSSSSEWVNIYDRLYRERIIFICQEIDHNFANQIISIMLYLDSENSSKPIQLYINSPGGSIISGMAIFDTIKHVKSEVITINIGMAASMASFILASGTKGKRFALPHSRIMIHQPIGGTEGQAEEIRIEANQILKIKDRTINLYSRMTGLPRNRIANDMDREKFMSSHEAKDLGFIDYIL